jgi:SnoaL-like domain
MLFAILIVLVSCCSSADLTQVAGNTDRKTTSSEFQTLMRTLGAAWNSNDAKRAAECFTEDALYSSPPSPRIRRGRQALFEFFGGSKGRPGSMRMEWY